MEPLLLGGLLLWAAHHLARSFSPGTYAAAIRLLKVTARRSWQGLRWSVLGSDDRRRRKLKGAQRHLPPRRKRRGR